MKTIMELLRKPLVRIIALVLILYFGLFANKKNPDSLGNRLSADRIKEDFNEMHEKTSFIISNIDKARQVRGGNVAAVDAPLENFSAITFKDVKIGTGSEELKCGDEAYISYDIRVVGSENSLESISEEKLLIGSSTNSLLERKIIGMKSGGVRTLNIPRDFKSSNQKLAFLLKFNEAALQYRVTLLKFSASNSDKVRCSNNDESKENAE